MKGTRLVPCRIDVDEKWDHKVCGLLVGGSLAGCGDYVDFVPRNLPHIVCPPFVKQHPVFEPKRSDLLFFTIFQEIKTKSTYVASALALRAPARHV